MAVKFPIRGLDMGHATRNFVRFASNIAIYLAIGGCGTFHPKPFPLFPDDPGFDPDSAAIVSLSPLEEDEYTVITGVWSHVGIAREGESSWRYSEDKWWVSLPPGDFVISVKAPDSESGFSYEARNVDGELEVEKIELPRAGYLHIPVSVESGKKYRLVRTRNFGQRTYELREMDYIGDLYNSRRK